MTLDSVEASKTLYGMSADALRLGTLGALAARIEPQLLRRLRLEVEPDLDAGAEAELWFSNLVDFHAPTGLVLTTRALPVLRERLAADADRLDAAWRVTSAVHATASPALRVEEELTYLGLRGLEQPGAEDRARILLRRVIRALVERRTSGLPGWANRALPRLPRELLALEEAGMVAYAAALRLGRASPIAALGEGTAASGEGWAWLIPPARRLIPMSVRWVAGGIEFGPRGLDKSHPIDVSALLPLSVHVWPGGLETGPGYAHQLQFSGRSFLPVDGDNAVVQILGGDRITLRRIDDEDNQSRLRRVSRPRVHLTYEVETEGAEILREFPFVVGVMGDFAGRAISNQPLADRKFISIDVDNFDEVMSRFDPRIDFAVADSEGDDAAVTVALSFRSIDDFSPARVADRVSPIKHILDLKRAITQLDEFATDAGELVMLLDDFLRERERLPAVIDEIGARADVLQRSDAGPSGAPAEAGTELAALVRQLTAALHPLSETQSLEVLGILARTALQGIGGPERDVKTTLRSALFGLDARITGLLNAVMHHPAFRKLEGSWRGLYYLVTNSETGELLKIRVLSVTKTELLQDLEPAAAFDATQTFKQVYENEYGVSGGEPYGALIGDYEWTNDSDDVRALRLISSIAAASFAPFISGVSPAMFGMSTFQELARPRELATIFNAAEYLDWSSYRDTDDSCFVVLTLPRTLARAPHDGSLKIEGFAYEEALRNSTGEPTVMDPQDYCWMNTAYVLGARLTDAFAKTGICMQIRGAEGGGRVDNLPTHVFATDTGDVDTLCPTEIGITDRREMEVSSLGFLPICHYKNTDYAVFFGAQTTQRTKVYDRPEATANAAIAARLPYLMVTGRFALYLKVIGRDAIGSFMTAEDCERRLNRWINNYVNFGEATGPETRARYPLREARIEVTEVPGRTGQFDAVAYMRPWLVLEELTTSMRVVIRVPRAAPMP
jgi:type VI secretion system protein ImpC